MQFQHFCGAMRNLSRFIEFILHTLMVPDMLPLCASTCAAIPAIQFSPSYVVCRITPQAVAVL